MSKNNSKRPVPLNFEKYTYFFKRIDEFCKENVASFLLERQNARLEPAITRDLVKSNAIVSIESDKGTGIFTSNYWNPGGKYSLIEFFLLVVRSKSKRFYASENAEAVLLLTKLYLDCHSAFTKANNIEEDEFVINDII